MKRLLLISGAIVLMTTPYLARAQGSDPSFDAWTGWRAGIQLGVNRNSYDGFSSSNTLTTSLEGGYDYRVNWNLVIGGDLYREWNSDSGHTVNAFPGTNANFGSRSYGVDFLAGFPVNNFLPYVKVGYGHVSLSGDLSGSTSSARYGIGMMWRINPQSALVFQYMYQKVSIPSPFGNADLKNVNLTVGYNWFFNF